MRFLPDAHDFPTEDPEVWKSLDTRSVREALLQVDEKYRVSDSQRQIQKGSVGSHGDAHEVAISLGPTGLSRKHSSEQALSAADLGAGVSFACAATCHFEPV